MTDHERIALLQERLGVSFADPEPALSALTHKSYRNEHPYAPEHNERLEFLGDAVVDLAISHRLMERFPKADEGTLSKLRAMLVNEASLAEVAEKIGLGELLLLGKGEERSGGRQKSSLRADALEAVIGAVYLSVGMERTLAVLDPLFADLVDRVTENRAGRDFKTRLQEKVQKGGGPVPRYTLVSASGPDHAKSFEVEVSAGESCVARASGRTKKEAEQAAARKALELLELAAGDPPKDG